MTVSYGVNTTLRNTGLFTSLLKRRKGGIELKPPGLPTFVFATIANTDGRTASLRITPTPATGNPTERYRVELQRRNADDTDWDSEHQEREVLPGVLNITQFRVSTLDLQDVLQRQKFRVRIRAENGDGFSDWTAYQETTTPGAAPGLPTFTILGVADTIGTGYIRVTPTPATAGNQATSYRYAVEIRNTADTAWEASYNELDEPLGQFDIANFQLSETRSDSIHQQRKYRVRLRAINRGGLSAWTAYQEVTIPLGVPNTPQLDLKPLNASIAVFIQPSILGTAAVNYGYEIRRRRNDNTGWGPTRDEVTTTNTFFIVTMEATTAIFNAARYQIRVRAKNSGGNSPWTDWEEVTPAATAQSQAPNTPEFRAEGGDARIVIEFIVPDASGGSPASFAYQLRRRNAAGTRWAAAQDAVAFTTAPVTITQYNASNTIENGRRHQIRIRAVNSNGNSGWTQWIEITPAAGVPGLPTFAISSRADGANAELVLTITAPTTGGAVVQYDYEMQRRNAANTDWDTTTTNQGSASNLLLGIALFEVNGVFNPITRNTRYRVRLRARNSGGESEWTAWQEITTLT